MARIARIAAQRLNLGLRQSIAMSVGTLREQHVLLVRMTDTDGAEGVGEAVVMGGPYWGQETIEGVQAAVENHIAPNLIGKSIDTLGELTRLLRSVVRGNPAARSAVEMAAFDLVGRKFGVPVCMLLGGACRTEVPVAWTLSTGSTEGDIDDGERAIAENGFRRFKLKFGCEDPRFDVERAAAIIGHFEGRASVIADVNQGWDEDTAVRWLPKLAEAGLEALEQPLPVDRLEAAAALQRRFGLRFLADEALSGPRSALRIVETHAAGVLVLKPNRDGGLAATRDVAAIAAAAGIGLYGGTMIETSLGTAASLHCFAASPELSMGCELFGPLRLMDDIVQEPLVVKDGVLVVPHATPGLGVRLDEDKVAWLAAKL